MTELTLRVCKVYALFEFGKPDEIRYIGQTCGSLSQRLLKHLWDVRNSHRVNPHLAGWIGEVLASGGKVDIMALDGNAVLDVTERQMISDYRALGHDLLNIRPGGGGASALLGRKRPADVLEKAWATRYANGSDRPSEETKAKMSLSQRSRERTQEERQRNAERLRRIRKGQKFGPLSEEHKRKVSEGLTGKPKTPEHVAAVAAALRGRSATEDAREMLRRGQQRRWAHIDWDGLEKAVRQTDQSYSAIAKAFSVSPECVRKRSIKGEWRG